MRAMEIKLATSLDGVQSASAYLTEIYLAMCFV